MTVQDVLDLDLAYTPPFSSVWDPVAVAARGRRLKAVWLGHRADVSRREQLAAEEHELGRGFAVAPGVGDDDPLVVLPLLAHTGEIAGLAWARIRRAISPSWPGSTASP